MRDIELKLEIELSTEEVNGMCYGGLVLKIQVGGEKGGKGSRRRRRRRCRNNE